MSIRDTILANKSKLKKEKVVTQFTNDNGEAIVVFVREMTSRERDAFELSMMDMKAKKNIRAALAAKVIVDEQGNKVFNEADIEALGELSGAAMDEIFQTVLKLNAVSPKDVEDLAKNS